MFKPSKVYVCQKCGVEYMRWMGKCESCGEWNSLIESQKAESARQKMAGQVLKPQNFSEIQSQKFRRAKSGILEFDRVLGGGIVPGSVILISGDPGIGKSTLVLQVASRIADKNTVLYISGEESADQVKMRADRMGINTGNLQFLAETNIDNVVATICHVMPQLVILDSIQTVFSESIESPSGSVNQVKESTTKLIEIAKENQISVILIGHVTKEGQIAGPKTLEHLVDTVLYLEGDRFHQFRILRSSKNRFGTTSETGVFEMKESGFSEVKNPSELFLEERNEGISGSVVCATLEGSRSFLVEIQALTSWTNFGYPKRTASGYDFNRLQLLIAVLQKRANLKLASQDVYVSVVGGIKIKEPACDLACALAIASAFLGKAADPKMVAIGEVGLSGEVRSASQIEKRISEAQNLGFQSILIPNVKVSVSAKACEIIRVKTVCQAIEKGLI